MLKAVTLIDGSTSGGDTPVVDLESLVQGRAVVFRRPSSLTLAIQGSLDGSYWFSASASSTALTRRLDDSPPFRFVRATVGMTNGQPTSVGVWLVFDDDRAEGAPTYDGGTFTLTRSP